MKSGHSFEQFIQEARDALGRDNLKASWSEGRIMQLDQAMEYALALSGNKDGAAAGKQFQ
jgi:hypothetical protein